MQEIQELALSVNQIGQSIFFRQLRQGIGLENFKNSISAFGVAIDHWSRIFGKLLYQLPSHHERLIVIKNLYDEHGDGDISKCHVITFQHFLNSLPGTISSEPSPVLNFNMELDRMLDEKSWIYTTSALAMIEYTYITVSKEINEYVSQFINKDDIHHYDEHAVIDVTHSNELFSLVAPHYLENKDLIDSGVIHGYKLLLNLYTELAGALNPMITS